VGKAIGRDARVDSGLHDSVLTVYACVYSLAIAVSTQASNEAKTIIFTDGGQENGQIYDALGS
jgi:hypothetical protein